MRHLFLKGDSGTGKTRLLHEVLESYTGSVGGFLTRRLLDEDGETAGFCLAEIETAHLPEATGEYRPDIPGLFIRRTPEGWEKYPEVFETMGVGVLERMRKNSLGILDEIGGVEMKSERFMDMLYQVLGCGTRCIGVIKNERNLVSMGTRVPMEQDSRQDRTSLEWRLIQEYGGQVLEYTGEQQESVAEQVRGFVYATDLVAERR